MILRCYSVYDTIAQVHCPPFFSRSEVEAMRSVSEVVNNPQSMLFSHSADYHLKLLSLFDDVSGKFSPVESSEEVNLIKLKKRNENEQK